MSDQKFITAATPAQRALDKICADGIRLPNSSKNFVRVRSYIEDLTFGLEPDEYDELIDLIEGSPLFESKDISSKDDDEAGVREVLIKLAPGTRAILVKYGGYLNYMNRKVLTEKQAIDYVFDHLKEYHTVSLEDLFKRDLIEYDNKFLFSVLAKIKSSNLADVEETRLQGGSIIDITINGKGLDELADKTYSQYKEELKSKSVASQTINISGGVRGSQIAQGRDLNQDLTRSEFHHNENQYPKTADTDKKNMNIIEKIKDFTNHEVIGSLTAAALMALLGLVGKFFGWW